MTAYYRYMLGENWPWLLYATEKRILKEIDTRPATPNKFLQPILEYVYLISFFILFTYYARFLVSAEKVDVSEWL